MAGGLYLSGVARIHEACDDPMVLFRLWFEESRSQGLQKRSSICCLSTASSEGNVSARHLLLRRLDKDGFVFVTDVRSKKAKELQEHPQCAATFVWVYDKEGQNINRQVRIEGNMIKLERDDYQQIYDNEPLYCKIRAYACHQGNAVVWEDLKQKHDQLLEDYESGSNDLPMPQHFAGYKLVPTMLDFYHAHDEFFGDRMCYLHENGDWRHFRVAA